MNTRVPSPEPTQVEHRGVFVLQHCGGRGKQIPEMCWPIRLASWESSKPVRDPVSKEGGRRGRGGGGGQLLRLSSDFHAHTHTYMGTHTHILTHSHKHKYRHIPMIHAHTHTHIQHIHTHNTCTYMGYTQAHTRTHTLESVVLQPCSFSPVWERSLLLLFSVAS